MPIYKIEVSQYECMHCGYRWINRINGNDGNIPSKCAKCKRMYWNGWGQEYPKRDRISPEERGLRLRLHRFEGTLNKAMGFGTQYHANELCQKFLDLNPRPTRNELLRALFPLGWNPRSRKNKNFVRNPDKPGYLKYDTSRRIPNPENPDEWKYNDDPNFLSDYQKLLIEESQKRKEIMKEIIKSRGVEFQEPIVKHKSEKKKTYDELLEGVHGKTKKLSQKKYGLDPLVKQHLL